MFYAFLVKMPSSFPEYRWPSSLPRIRNPGGTTPGAVSYPDVSLPWGRLSWGTSLNCAGDVALDPLQIGIGNPPDLTINFTLPPASNTVNNRVVARPRNLRPVNPLPAGTIQADFFLANWGSQVPASAFWRKISPATAPRNLLDIPAGPPGNDIHFDWVVPNADRCWYLDSNPNCAQAGEDHQCMLVQLSQVTPATPTPNPAPLVFRNQSTYRNMVFVGTSSAFRREAEISVVGLTPIPDARPTRDVYLYVETVNMPARITPGAIPSAAAIVSERDTLIVAEHDTALKLEWGTVRLERGDSAILPVKDTIPVTGEDNGDRFAAVRRAGESGRLTVPEVDAYLPTYRVHAYHATGDSLGSDPVLEPQTSFGYWVDHKGEIIGWRHRLEGENLVELAPNYYKIAVPNYGTAKITTIIEALEPRRFALSLHTGVSLPHGSFNTTHDAGFGITADAEYWWSPRLAVAALVAYHRFGGESSNPDLDLLHMSVAVESRVTFGNPSVLVDVGGGLYDFSPGSSDPGVHAGAGVEFDATPTVSLGVTARVHTVFTSGSNTTFSALQAGGRFRF
jgi:hypothetical protein